MSNRLTVRRARPNIIPLFKAWVTRRLKEERERYRSMRYCLYDDYGDEYDEEMAALRRYYGSCFPHSRIILNPLDDEDAEEWDDDDYDDINYDDYYVGDDGEIIFPSGGVIHNRGSEDSTLRPGQTRKSAQEMDDYWNKMSKFNEGGKKKHRKHRGKKKGAKVIDINKPYDSNFIDDDSGDALENCTIYFYEDYHNKYDRTEFTSLYDFDQYCKDMGFHVPSYLAEAIAYSPVSHCCLSPAAKEHGILEIMREETYGDLFYEACETSELSET